MLKISESKRVRRTTILRLEGRLVGPWVGELSQVWESLAHDGRRLELDLGEVTFADERGVELLVSLHTQGVRLRNLTPFVVEQLKVNLPSARR